MIKKSVVGIISDSEMTTVYTVPNGKTCELVMLWITNPDSTNKTIEVEFYNKSDDATVTILDDFRVDQKDFIQIGGTENSFVIMSEGDKLRAQGSNNSNFKLIAALKEHNSIVQGG